MKKFLLLIGVLFLSANSALAINELSQQATAFYSDNNFNKTMDLLLQINENERSGQSF